MNDRMPDGVLQSLKESREDSLLHAAYEEIVRLRGMERAAVELCRIYFEIAASALGEDEVCARRDAMLAERIKDG